MRPRGVARAAGLASRRRLLESVGAKITPGKNQSSRSGRERFAVLRRCRSGFAPLFEHAKDDAGSDRLGGWVGSGVGETLPRIHVRRLRSFPSTVTNGEPFTARRSGEGGQPVDRGFTRASGVSRHHSGQSAASGSGSKTNAL